jgi:glutaminase A-like protein/uncharacterized protein DUF5127/uncharacterized protein DUF4964
MKSLRPCFSGVIVAVLAAALVLFGGRAPAQTPSPVRPPAVPLVTHDPYFSAWSMRDRLTDDWSRHWTGAVHAMCGMARIDGKPYRFLGPAPATVPPMQQVGMEVLPTRTLYHFEAEGIRLGLTFTTPALAHDLELLSRPVTYVTWDVRATDGGKHRVSLYFDATAEWAVNRPNQRVVWSRGKPKGLDLLRIGTEEQPVLAKAGDNLRIDWGYLYVAKPAVAAGEEAITSDQAARDGFAAAGDLPDVDDTRMPRPVSVDWPVLATTFDLGIVGTRPASRHLLLAYDDLYSIQYFGRNLRPWWRRTGMQAEGLLQAAERDYAALTRRCREYDAELMTDLRRAGGEKYAQLAALAFRQCLAAHKLVADPDGRPLYFSKENFSNGCIATVDVTYPSSPFFLLLNPTLLKGQLIPILEYAGMPRWRFAFAPHDLGTYPKANGQVYGGGERSEENQMPVEECGNMLLMVGALAKTEGNAAFARGYWPVLTRWAEYLREKGLDPENQLCTDDFAGHLAHNTNLSLKAILGLGSYAMLCDMLGYPEDAAAYRKTTQAMAEQWVKMAKDGDHFRLTFDRPGTWSQKYNLVWDRLLGLNLFPSEVARTEVAYYKTKQNRYGLPLDSRKSYTKLDWILWSATLAERQEDFEALVEPIHRFAHESPSRVPLTDWYETMDGKQVGFQARSVVGGVFIKMLADPATWRRWSRRAQP